MILGKDDINAIADEVLRRLGPILNTLQANSYPSYGIPLARRLDINKEMELRLEEWRQKKAEDDRLELEIRLASEKMPVELRPVPEQYKSRSRKVQVLELVKDPTRWAEVPLLSKQWPGVKRK